MDKCLPFGIWEGEGHMNILRSKMGSRRKISLGPLVFHVISALSGEWVWTCTRGGKLLHAMYTVLTCVGQSLLQGLQKSAHYVLIRAIANPNKISSQFFNFLWIVFDNGITDGSLPSQKKSHLNWKQMTRFNYGRQYQIGHSKWWDFNFLIDIDICLQTVMSLKKWNETWVTRQ